MRFGVVLLTGMLWASLYADRLIEIPTGRIVYPERARLEAGIFTGKPERERLLLNWRVVDTVELQLSRSALDERRIETAGIAYNLYPEIPGYTPGISVGVADLWNRTEVGRSGYLAISYALPALGETPLDKDLRIHLGYRSGRTSGLFVGFEVPLTNRFSILAEHTGSHINSALVWQPASHVEIRAGTIRDRVVWSILVSVGE
ncbi:MAG: hypothetical protein SNJ72_07255 [Fimbriimonadales bacterium]